MVDVTIHYTMPSYDYTTEYNMDSNIIVTLLLPKYRSYFTLKTGDETDKVIRDFISYIEYNLKFTNSGYGDKRYIYELNNEELQRAVNDFINNLRKDRAVLINDDEIDKLYLSGPITRHTVSPSQLLYYDLDNKRYVLTNRAQQRLDTSK